MTLEPTIARLVDEARAGARADAATARRALGLVDLTSLNHDDTEERIAALCDRAVTPAGPVAAVCVWPRFVTLARERLRHTPVRVATVVNFPAGGDDAAAVADETSLAVHDGAHEVDVVIPYRQLVAGGRTVPHDVLRACRAACGADVTMKVILETGELGTRDLVELASRDAIAAGADFLKTSTGKAAVGATPEAAAVMLAVIRDLRAAGRAHVGFKAAGGIRNTVTAGVYLALSDRLLGPDWARTATFRFGASGLLDDLLAHLGHGPATPPKSAGY